MKQLSRRQAILACTAALGGLAGLPGQGWSGQSILPAPRPSGRVAIRQTQFAVIGSLTSGEGTLAFKGRSYAFWITGLGFGGLGVTAVDAAGDVYNLASPADLEGTYGQVRAGWALERLGDGHLWLENEKGVVWRLAARHEGRMLAGSADILRVQLR